jgi:hypothetical protein
MDLSLPVDPVRPLTEQESAPLKDVLIQWASSARRLDAAALKENLKVRSAQRVPVCEISLSTLLETRSPAEDADQPYDENVPASAADVPGGVWDFPSEVKKDFTASQGAYVIETTRRRVDCAACGAAGTARCGACAGEGKLTCANCRGRGKFSCDACNGMAKTKCLKCSGRGMKAGVTLMVSSKDACEDCQGGGQIPCTRCEHGTVKCPLCGAVGVKSCDRCAGKGSAACAACQGRGKLVKAKVFRAQFAPVHGAAAAGGLPVPKPALDKALAGKKPGGSTDLTAGLTEADVAASVCLEGVKGALRQLLQKVAPSLSPNTRVAYQRLSWSGAEITRLDGTFFDQEFVAWVLPEAREVHLEVDPLRNLGEASGKAAEHAHEAKDWKKALELARKTLAFDPHHAEARRILEEWKRKAWRDGLLGGVAAGAAIAVAFAVWVYQFEKGLHKSGPALQLGALAVAAGAALGALSTPALLKAAQRQVRLLTAVLPAAAGATLLLVCVRFVFGWNPVASADQKALDAAMKERFATGVSEVYWEDDLRFLEELSGRYRGTRADLAAVDAGLEKQKNLKAARERLVAEMEAKLAAAARAETPPAEKIAQLKELRSLYVLNTMEPAPVDKAIADEEARVKRAAEEAAKNRGRMSILSDGRQIVKPNKEEAKKLAKQMDADLKKVLAASSSPQDKKKRLESLKTSYESKGMGTAPIDKEIKKLDQQLAKSKAKPAAKKSSSRKR